MSTRHFLKISVCRPTSHCLLNSCHSSTQPTLCYPTDLLLRDTTPISFPFRQVPSQGPPSPRTLVMISTYSTALFPTRRLCFGVHSSYILHSDTCRRQLCCHPGHLYTPVLNLQPNPPPDNSAPESILPIFSIPTHAVTS